MDNAIRVRIDGPQALYIADCLRRERQAAHLPLGPGSLAAYWQQLIEERLDGDGFFLWVPLHIAPHGAELAESYDLAGNDVLDIAIALSDWGYDHMARLWAQLYASLAWNVAREILPAGLSRSISCAMRRASATAVSSPPARNWWRQAVCSWASPAANSSIR